MEFTNEEIALCKKIAEKHRRKIKFGDWLIINFQKDLGEQVTLFDTSMTETPNRFPKTSAIYIVSIDKYFKEFFPLWQISDCLEFIFERGLYLLGLCQSDEHEFSFGYCELDETGMVKNEATIKEIYGETPLGPCLKAVLAIVEEK